MFTKIKIFKMIALSSILIFMSGLTSLSGTETHFNEPFDDLLNSSITGQPTISSNLTGGVRLTLKVDKADLQAMMDAQEPGRWAAATFFCTAVSTCDETLFIDAYSSSAGHFEPDGSNIFTGPFAFAFTLFFESDFVPAVDIPSENISPLSTVIVQRWNDNVDQLNNEVFRAPVSVRSDLRYKMKRSTKQPDQLIAISVKGDDGFRYKIKVKLPWDQKGPDTLFLKDQHIYDPNGPISIPRVPQGAPSSSPLIYRYGSGSLAPIVEAGDGPGGTHPAQLSGWSRRVYNVPAAELDQRILDFAGTRMECHTDDDDNGDNDDEDNSGNNGQCDPTVIAVLKIAGVDVKVYEIVGLTSITDYHFVGNQDVPQKATP